MKNKKTKNKKIKNFIASQSKAVTRQLVIHLCPGKNESCVFFVENKS